VYSALFPVNGLVSLQLEELALAFVLSALVGVEREIRQKSAGLRTHTLVGVSAALIMLISKYGFMDVLDYGVVVLDPSRVAAQIVSGIGFIGGGVIFMRRDVVRGLTTAASIWFTAALGMACGAGLLVLSLATMVFYCIIMLAFPLLARRLPRSRKLATDVQISYAEKRGLLGNILIRCTELRFAVERVRVSESGAIEGQDMLRTIAAREQTDSDFMHTNIVTLTLTVKGKRPVSHLIAALGDMAGVQDVGIANEDGELD